MSKTYLITTGKDNKPYAVAGEATVRAYMIGAVSHYGAENVKVWSQEPFHYEETKSVDVGEKSDAA